MELEQGLTGSVLWTLICISGRQGEGQKVTEGNLWRAEQMCLA